jgi:hypothetical protein
MYVYDVRKVNFWDVKKMYDLTVLVNGIENPLFILQLGLNKIESSILKGLHYQQELLDWVKTLQMG